MGQSAVTWKNDLERVRSAMNHLEKILRAIGFGSNLVFFLVFVFAAIKLWGVTAYLLATAGGFMEFGTVRAIFANPTAGAVYLWTLMVSPGFFDRILGFGGAWFSIIAAAGCSWMSLLGGRWLYNEVLRLTVK